MATIPSALTGVDIVIFAASFSYVSDVSTTNDRTLRITILELSYLVTMPTGIALGMQFYYSAISIKICSRNIMISLIRQSNFPLLGSYLFNHVVGKSYGIMFSINAAFVTTAILYSAFCLKVLTMPFSKSILHHNSFELFNFYHNSGVHHCDKHPYVKLMDVWVSLVTFSIVSM